MASIAPRIMAYSASDVGEGVILSRTSRQIIAPMSPIAPIVCRNFKKRRIGISSSFYNKCAAE
jgi:hypothetical protein